MKNSTTPDIFTRRTLKAFFTTKKAGADQKSIGELTGIPKNNIYIPIQMHTEKVFILRSDMTRKVADSIITKRKDILIGIGVADCVPILLYDSRRMLCGAVHAGWKGTAGGILMNTIGAMVHEFYSKPTDMLIAIGPAIRWCCYNVGADVLTAVVSSTGEGYYYEKRGEKICLDLPSANKVQALKMGIHEENIWMSNECTYCFPDKYYSYRFSKGPTGRQGGFIGMFSH